MTRILQLAGIIALLTAAVFFGELGYTVHKVRPQIVSSLNVGGTVQKLDTVLTRLNSPTGPISELDKLLLALKSTTVHVDLAARHYDQQLTTLDGQELTLFSDAHGTLTAGQGALNAFSGTANQATADLQTANGSIAAITPFVTHLDTTTVTANSAVQRFNDLLADPNLALMEQHFAGMSASGDHIMSIGDQLFTKETHSTLHPSHNPFARTWQATSPYLPLTAKTLGCYLVPGSCL